jgi:single-strand DNA-binding protein
MNTVHVIGNIGSEPKVTRWDSGKMVARFSVAVNGGKKDKEGNSLPTWIPLEMWDDAVERLLKCQAKAKLTGRKIQVTGALAPNEYNKEVGDAQVPIKSLKVKVHSFELFGLKQEAEPAPEGEPELPPVDAPAKAAKK